MRHKKGVLTDRFFYYIAEGDSLENTVDDWNKIKYYKECINELEERMNEKFEEFKNRRKKEEKLEKVTLTKEMEIVIAWWNEYKYNQLRK